MSSGTTISVRNTKLIWYPPSANIRRTLYAERTKEMTVRNTHPKTDGANVIQ